jgi:hypothetical protein
VVTAVVDSSKGSVTTYSSGSGCGWIKAYMTQYVFMFFPASAFRCLRLTHLRLVSAS